MSDHQTVAQALAGTLLARKNCIESGNEEWEDRWTEWLQRLTAECLPSGGGFDLGTKIDLDKSTERKLVFKTSFHHMSDYGMYVGWSDHVITVESTFSGMDIKVSGRDRNGIKDYIADTFLEALRQEAPELEREEKAA